MTDSTETLHHIRNQLPAVREKVFLNTGTCGPLPVRSADVVKQTIDRELQRGRSDKEHAMESVRTKTELRSALAGLIQAKPQEITLTQHTTEGMNTALWGLNWQPGDEAIVTNMEHEGGLAPLSVLRQRKGVTLKFWNVNQEKERMLDELQRMISPRTRLILCSHVLWSSGAVLPLKDIVRVAHEKNVYVLVDGAQSVGAVPVNVKDTDVDFYAFPGQKWLCGPEGTGGLYISEARLSEVALTYAGWASVKGETLDETGHFMPVPGAPRFEVGGAFSPKTAGLLASLKWLEQDVGWDWIFQRITANYARFREAMATVPGLTVTTPKDTTSGLVNFFMEGVTAANAVHFLAERDINIRYIPSNMSLRVSTGFYNDEQDLHTFISALHELNDRYGQKRA